MPPSQKVRPPPSKACASSPPSDHRSTGKATTTEPSTFPAPSTCCDRKRECRFCRDIYTQGVLGGCPHFGMLGKFDDYPSRTLSKACSPGCGVYLVTKVMSRWQPTTGLRFFLSLLHACCCRYQKRKISLHASKRGEKCWHSATCGCVVGTPPSMTSK